MVTTDEKPNEAPQIQTLLTKPSIYGSGLLLLSSYVIAILLTTVFHEGGHAIALASISIRIRLVLNPFSSSMVQSFDPIPQNYLAFAAAAGTIVELLFGTIMILIFWRFRTSRLVPLLMCGPVAYLKSGGYFLVGVSIPEGDTALMVSLGIPVVLVYSLGLLFLIIGSVSMILLFPLLGIDPEVSLRKLFMILFIGLIPHGIGMIVFALAFNPFEISIGIANVIFMAVTVTIFTGIYVKKNQFFDRIAHTEVTTIDRTGMMAIVLFAIALIIIELLLFN